ISLMMLSLDTAYRSFGGEVEASSTPTICRLSDSRRHQLSAIARVWERRFHRGFTAAEKTELWDRWKRGESLKAIGRAFGKPSSSIYFLLAPHGGIGPAVRRRSRLALTLAEREVI